MLLVFGQTLNGFLGRTAVEGMTNKANSRFFGAVLLCCAAMAAGYGYYDSANGRAIAELKAKTAQMKAQNESLRRQTAADVEQARAVLSTWGRPGRETETPLLMTGEFDRNVGASLRLQSRVKPTVSGPLRVV